MNIGILNDDQVNNSVWAMSNTVQHVYPWLSYDECTEVCIVGGDIMAAMCALEFAKFGIKVVLISDLPIGFSRFACDAVVRSNLDGNLFSMCNSVGMKSAMNLYNKLNDVFGSVQEFLSDTDMNCWYMTDNITCTTSEDTEYDFRKEYLFTRHGGAQIDILTGHFGVDSINLPKKIQFGLMYRNQAIVVDPYLFIHQVIKKAIENGAVVYENSPALSIGKSNNGCEIQTISGRKVFSQKVIVTDSILKNRVLKCNVNRGTVFTVMTNKIPELCGDSKKFPVISFADHPKVEIFVTNDGRIVASGLESGSVSRSGKIAGVLATSSVCKNKYKHLLSCIRKTFSDDIKFECDFVSNSVFAMRNEFLPLVSRSEKDQDIYLAFAPRDNQISFSVVAANVLLDMYKGIRESMSDE